MGSLEADIRMEERRKKSRGENLEDRQMKRYMRSLKRKARKENQSQVRTPESTVAFTEALNLRKQKLKTKRKQRSKLKKLHRLLNLRMNQVKRLKRTSANQMSL